MKKFLMVVILGLVMALPAGAQTTSPMTREQIRQEMRQAVTNFRTNRRQAISEFRQNLAEVKDLRHKRLAEAMDKRLCEINKRRTTNMADKLDKMTELLDKVEARAKGTEVSTAVANARTAIAEAQKSVAGQAAAPCGVKITDGESSLRSDIASARVELTNQLKTTHQMIVAARKAVSTAIRVLAKLMGEVVPEPVND